MAGPTYTRTGASTSDRSGIGTAVTSNLVVVKFEDGSEAHVTPQHAAQIRSRAAKFIRNARGTGEQRGAKDVKNDYRS